MNEEEKKVDSENEAVDEEIAKEETDKSIDDEEV